MSELYEICQSWFLMLQQVVDTKLRELLGERTAADDEKPVKKKKEKPAKVEVGSSLTYAEKNRFLTV